MIDRRRFIGALGGAFAGTLGAGASDARAQPAGRVQRVAVLRQTARPPAPDQYTFEWQYPKLFAKRGYVEGKNLAVDLRYADGDLSRLPALAKELVEQRYDVIVAVGAPALRAAMAATTTIPIVLFNNVDPVAAGFVQSLARPGRNVTGVLITSQGTLAAKKLELMKEAIPTARRIAALAPPDLASQSGQVAELQQAAATLRLDVPVIPMANGDLADAFARVLATKPDGVFVMADSFFVFSRRAVIAQALQHRLPTTWEWWEQVADGGLMAYGTSLASRYEALVTCVDRVLKGGNPAEIPIDLPTRVGLALNLRTAKAIGLALPKTMVQRSDELIQ